MKISYKWLLDYIRFDLSPSVLAEKLTLSGLEVENVTPLFNDNIEFNGLTIGEVISCEKHPNADKLKLTAVDIGTTLPLQIVCGAPNVNVHQKVVVATDGCELTNISNDKLVIKKTKIRGILSEGMICAEDEIGLGHSHDGILILKTNLKNGESFSRYVEQEQDYIFEIGLTPNRADATSHLGVAREIKGLLGLPLKTPDVSAFKTEKNDLSIEIKIEDSTGCKRYAGVSIGDVKIGESPQWLKKRLTSIGLKPINNIVDITNYVLFETGQPLHAFDADKILGKQIIVKTLPEGLPFQTLDGKERKLLSTDLMICDAEKPMCIAGVFGGLESGVTENTTNIFLESAYFNPSYIRKTEKHHQLHTDAAFRFSRGADPEMVIYALKRAALLIKEVTGGYIASEINDVYPAIINKPVIRLYFSKLNIIAGQPIDPEKIISILTGLDIEIVEKTTEYITASIPLFRVDVKREIDLIEEILRINGYHHINIPEKINFSPSFSNETIEEQVFDNISYFLTSLGFTEIQTNSFISSAQISKYRKIEDEFIFPLNPLSEDFNLLRPDLITSILNTISYNQNRKIYNQKLFELGNVYSRSDNKFTEKKQFILSISGSNHPDSWYFKGKSEFDIFQLKGYIQSVLSRLEINDTQTDVFDHALYDDSIAISKENIPFIHIGCVKKTISEKIFEIKNEVFSATIEWDILLEFVSKAKIRFEQIPKFPWVKRDISFFIENYISYKDIENSIRSLNINILKEITLFDVFQQEEMGEKKKSMAISFVFQDLNKTLTDIEVETGLNKIIEVLESRFNAKIRSEIRN